MSRYERRSREGIRLEGREGEKEEQTHPLPASALLPSSGLFPSCSTALPGIRGLKLSVITRGGRKEGERKSGVMACFCFYRGVYTTALHWWGERLEKGGVGWYSGEIVGNASQSGKEV